MVGPCRTMGLSRVGHARVTSTHIVVVAVAAPTGLDAAAVAQPTLGLSFAIFEATWIPIHTYLSKIYTMSVI